MLCYFSVSTWVVLSSGALATPARLAGNFTLDLFITRCFSIPLMLLLTFLVIDETKASSKLIRKLAKKKSLWPDSVNISSEIVIHNNDDYTSELIDAEFIARHTDKISKLIYYPIIVTVLMIGSRNNYFDNWNMSIGLILVMSLSMLYLIACALIMRINAEKSRKNITSRLSDYLLTKTCRQDHAAIEKLIALIQTNKHGAFAPYLEQPWLHSLLIFLRSSFLVFQNYLTK
ncbi:MAG: hypothetical protein GY868_12715 [Deltaproteobacteria bacterium]|nr:hypothetical protein [Deltaproteobacteria bacterium]